MQKTKKKKRSGVSVAFVYFATIFIVLLVLGFVAYFVMTKLVFSSVFKEKDERVKGVQYIPNNEEFHTVLFVVDDGTTPKTFMLARIKPEESEIALLPLPPTMISQINTKSSTLESFYNSGGIKSLCLAVENAFRTPVERYMVLDENLFRNLVLDMGEIKFPIAFDLYYKNEANGEITDIKRSDAEKLLNGDDIRKIMAYPNHPTGQKFNEHISGAIITTLINECMKSKDEIPDSLLKLFGVAMNIKKTNITQGDLERVKTAFDYILANNKAPAKFTLVEGDWGSSGEFIAFEYSSSQMKSFFGITK